MAKKFYVPVGGDSDEVIKIYVPMQDGVLDNWISAKAIKGYCSVGGLSKRFFGVIRTDIFNNGVLISNLYNTRNVPPAIYGNYTSDGGNAVTNSGGYLNYYTGTWGSGDSVARQTVINTNISLTAGERFDIGIKWDGSSYTVEEKSFTAPSTGTLYILFQLWRYKPNGFRGISALVAMNASKWDGFGTIMLKENPTYGGKIQELYIVK